MLAADPADLARGHAGRLRRRHHRDRDDGWRTETTMRDADSPNSVAFTDEGRIALAGRRAVTSALTPMPPVSNVHSASATARPPSEQSCADSTQPSRISLTIKLLQRRFALQVDRRRLARHGVVHRREVFAAAELAQIIAQQDDGGADAS